MQIVCQTRRGDFNATQRLPDITVYDPDGGFIAGAGSVISPEEYCSPTGCIIVQTGR